MVRSTLLWILGRFAIAHFLIRQSFRCLRGRHLPIAFQSHERGIMVCEHCMKTFCRWKGPNPPDNLAIIWRDAPKTSDSGTNKTT